MSQKYGGLAGMIAPAMSAFVVVVLTVLQYRFMVGLGWDPVGASDVPWPSAMALGPYGFLQVLNFVLFGIALMIFAAGLQRGVAAGRTSWAGPACLVVAGVASVLLGFETDPHTSAKAHTWHGSIHLGAFLVLGLSLLAALLLLWAPGERSLLAMLRMVFVGKRDARVGRVLRTRAGGGLPLLRHSVGVDGGRGYSPALVGRRGGLRAT